MAFSRRDSEHSRHIRRRTRPVRGVRDFFGGTIADASTYSAKESVMVTEPKKQEPDIPPQKPDIQPEPRPEEIPQDVPEKESPPMRL
jgi:hypothetical protein